MAYPKLSLSVGPKAVPLAHEDSVPPRLRNKVKKLGYSSMNVNGSDAIEPHPVNTSATRGRKKPVQGNLDPRADKLPLISS
jgi:hypothetical protein